MDKDFRKSQVEKRICEFSTFIDEMAKPDFLQKQLNFPPGIKLDFGKLIVNGHSMGGITSIGLAAKDPRIKACLSMDAWFFPFSDNLPNLSLKTTPLMQITSSTYFDDRDEKKLT